MSAKDKPHMSASQINMALRCGEQYRRRYSMGEKIRPSGAMARGSAAHKAWEINDIQKIKTRQDLSAEDVDNVFVEDFRRRVKEENPKFDEDAPKKDVEKSGRAIVKAYHLEVQPNIQPVAVEKEFLIAVDGAPPILGYIDLIVEDGTIVDRKTSGKKKSQPEDDWVRQLSLYAYAESIVRGLAPWEAIPTRVDLIVSKDKPENVPISVGDLTQAAARPVLALAARIHEAAIKDALLPNPNGWHCSEKFCGYWATCKYRKGA